MRSFIIAEAGVNHNGSIQLAKKLIDAASDARADAVKFQTFKAKNLVITNSKKADHPKPIILHLVWLHASFAANHQDHKHKYH